MEDNLGSKGSAQSTGRSAQPVKSETQLRVEHLQERIQVNETQMAEAMSKREARAKQLGKLSMEDLNARFASARRVSSATTKREKISAILENEHPVLGYE